MEHLCTDDDRRRTGETSKAHRQFGVALPDAQAAFGLPANRDVARRSEFITQSLHSRLTCDAIGQTSGRQLSKTPCGQRTVVVGDTGVSLAVIDGERKSRASIVAEIVRDEMVQHRTSFNSIRRGVEVLKEREPKTLTHFVPNGEEQQATAVLTKLAHGGWFSHRRWEKEIGFTFPLFRIEQTNGLPLLKRIDGALYTGLHVCRFGLTFMKSRIPSLLKSPVGSKLADSQQKGIIM